MLLLSFVCMGIEEEGSGEATQIGDNSLPFQSLLKSYKIDR